MSDRTSFQMTVYDCPGPGVADIVGVLDEYGLGTDWEGPVDPHATLVLGQQYNAAELRCGSAGEIAGILVAAGATFECWEDPAYEWLGEYHAHVPQLGHFSGECCAEGAVVVSAPTLLHLVRQAVSLEQLRAEVAALCGETWDQVLEPLRAMTPRPVAPLPDEGDEGEEGG